MSQDWVVSTVRSSEVAADPTVALALEAAAGRHETSTRRASGTARLATIQRVTRGQLYEAPDAFAHFSIFAMATAGRSQAGERFDDEALGEHLGVYVDALSGIADRVEIVLSTAETSVGRRLRDGIHERWASSFVTVSDDTERLGSQRYYRRACFKIHAVTPGGKVEFVDGGFTDWTERLLGDRHERLLISGAGLDRPALMPRAGPGIGAERMTRQGGEVRRHALIEEAIRAFGREGYSGASLDQIATAVGIRKQTLLYYFPTKDALLEACLQAAGQRVAQEIADALEGKTTYWDRAEAVIHAVFGLAEEWPEFPMFVREAGQARRRGVRALRERDRPVAQAGGRLPAVGDGRRRDPRAGPRAPAVHAVHGGRGFAHRGERAERRGRQGQEPGVLAAPRARGAGVRAERAPARLTRGTWSG